MQKKRKNPPAWYTFTNLSANTKHTIPLNRAARRALMKITGDIAMLPAVIKPLTKAERLAKMEQREAERAAAQRKIEESSGIEHSRAVALGISPSTSYSDRDEQGGAEQKEEAQAQEITQHETEASQETLLSRVD